MSMQGLNVFTGLRGHGKTIHTIDVIEKEIAFNRPVFSCNITDINMKGVMLLDDPNDWADLPAGALLVVDEAQKFWRTSRAGDIPKALTDMETARHVGISFLLITQDPSFLHPHIRKLTDSHVHHVRKNGFQAAWTYTWDRISEKPDSDTERKLAIKGLFNYPKRHFTKYKSAEIHTVKRTVPVKMIMVVGAFICIGLLVNFALGKAKSLAGSENEAAQDSSLRESEPQTSKPNGQLMPYTQKILPSQPTAPWTAPGFVSRNFESQPKLFCISSKDSCTCMTEQASIYHLDDDKCRNVARFGMPYNPFLSEQKTQIQQRLVKN